MKTLGRYRNQYQKLAIYNQVNFISMLFVKEAVLMLVPEKPASLRLTLSLATAEHTIYPAYIVKKNFQMKESRFL